MPEEVDADVRQLHCHPTFYQRLNGETGALMSTVSYNEGASVPGIAHGIVLEHC